MPISILIVDDHDAIRRALHRFFDSHPDFQVCGEAADGFEAIDGARRLKPDVVVLDFAMPNMNGLEVARKISSMFPDLPILMLTSHKSSVLESSARKAGIRAVVSKADGLERLREEIQKSVG